MAFGVGVLTVSCLSSATFAAGRVELNTRTSRLPLLKAEMMAQRGHHAQAIGAVDRILRDREQMELWEDALSRKLEWLANSGRSSQAVSEAKRAARSWEFSGMNRELSWWLVILYAGPEGNLRAAIREADDLSRGPRTDEFVERAAYGVGVMYRWSGNSRRATEALEDYLLRYGDDGRFSSAAETQLAEIAGDR